MWWQQNACLWLNGQSVHLLKTKRTWYGRVAFRQGHRDYEAKRDPDWMGQEGGVQSCLPELLQRYGLAGACASSSAGRASFGSACPWGRQTGRKPMPSSPVPAWSVKKGGLMTSRRLVRRKAVTGAVTGRSAPIRPNVSPLSAGLPALPEPPSSPSTCCPLFWAAFGQPVRGPWPFRKPPMTSSTASACATACPWPMTYRRLCRRLMGRSSAGSRTGQTRRNGSLPGRAKPCAA